MLLQLALTLVASVSSEAFASAVSEYKSYQFRPVSAPNRCLALNPGNGGSDAVAVFQDVCDTDIHENKLRLRKKAEGQYQIVTFNERCFSVAFDSTDPGTLVHQWGCSDATSYYFSFSEIGTAEYQIRNVNSGLCLSMASDAGGRGVPLVLGVCADVPQQRFVLHDLFGESYLQSSDTPIRVFFQEPKRELAEATLRYSEEMWRLFFGTWGFTPPPIDSELDYYQVVLEPLDNAHGVVNVVGASPLMPRQSCFNRMRLHSDWNQPQDLSVIAHEMVHAAQYSAACDQPLFTEALATYLQVLADARRWPILTRNTALYFQNEPWRSLVDNEGLYRYGVGLWFYYLADRFAAADGATLIRDIFNHDRAEKNHDGPVSLFRSIEHVLRQRGAGPLESVFLDFSEARYFLGRSDDGRHMRRAREFSGSEVSLAGSFTFGDLPLIGWTPPHAQSPAAWGANFLVLDLPPAAPPIRAQLDGDSSARWATRYLLLDAGGSVIQSFDRSNSEPLVIPSTGATKLVVVVVNLGHEDYEPCVFAANAACDYHAARYSFQAVVEDR